MFPTVPLSIIRSFSLYTQQTCMTYTIAVCTVKNFWCWTEELCESYRVLFQKQIWEISASGWFYYQKMNSLYILNLPRSATRVNYFFHLQCKHSAAECLAMNNATKRHPTTKPTLQAIEASWKAMAYAQKSYSVFRRDRLVHLNRRGRQFSRLLAAVVLLDTPCSQVVWRVLATHSIRQFPLHFPSHASPCAITFQLESTTRISATIRPHICRYFSSPVCNFPLRLGGHLR